MNPYYQNEENCGWYFELFDCIFGPYENEESAWERYNQVIGSTNGCKNCGD